MATTQHDVPQLGETARYLPRFPFCCMTAFRKEPDRGDSAMLSAPSVTALVYSDSDIADRTLRSVAFELMERGWHLAGLVQHNRPRPGRSRCDMLLEDLVSGDLIGISQDRGPLVRGCALDVGQLLVAMEIVRAGLGRGADLVILNKFGKTESEGGGFRAIIADVVEVGIPLLIAVPWRNIESWRLFAGGIAREFDLDVATAVDEPWSTRLGYTDVFAPRSQINAIRDASQ